MDIPLLKYLRFTEIYFNALNDEILCFDISSGELL